MPCFGTAILRQRVQGDAPEDGEVLSGVIHTDPALIFTERHIETPAHAILYTPVGTDGVDNTGCIGLHRAASGGRLLSY